MCDSFDRTDKTHSGKKRGVGLSTLVSVAADSPVWLRGFLNRSRSSSDPDASPGY